MAFKIHIERIADGESFGEIAPIAAEEIGDYIKTLSSPSMFGGGAFRFILIPA